jgi:hypothetical protein
LFSPEALELIAEASEGIPRQINNFCFHSLSLACATRSRTVDGEVVREVIKDLDITRFMTEVEVPSSMSRLASLTRLNADPLPPMPQMQASDEASEPVSQPTLSPRKPTEEKKLSPADAVQHMQNVSRLLRTWRTGLERPD